MARVAPEPLTSVSHPLDPPMRGGGGSRENRVKGTISPCTFLPQGGGCWRHRWDVLSPGDAQRHTVKGFSSGIWGLFNSPLWGFHLPRKPGTNLSQQQVCVSKRKGERLGSPHLRLSPGSSMGTAGPNPPELPPVCLHSSRRQRGPTEGDAGFLQHVRRGKSFKNLLFHTENPKVWLGRGRPPPGTEPPRCDSFLL